MQKERKKRGKWGRISEEEKEKKRGKVNSSN